MPTQLRRLWRLLAAAERRRMLLWSGPMLMAAVFEVASIGIILPVVLALSTPIENAGEVILFFRRGLETLAADRVGQVVSVAVLFALLFLIKNIYLFAVNFFFYRFLYSIQQRLMGALYGAYLAQRLETARRSLA